MAKNFYEKSDGRVRYEQRKKRHKSTSSMSPMTPLEEREERARRSSGGKRRPASASKKTRVTKVDLRENVRRNRGEEEGSILLTDNRRRSSRRVPSEKTQIIRRESFSKKEFVDRQSRRNSGFGGGINLASPWLIIGAIALVVIIALVVTFPLLDTKKQVVCELGSEMPSPTAFVKMNLKSNPTYIEAPFDEGAELTEVGVSDVRLHVYFMDVSSTIAVVDTTAPEVKVKNVSSLLGREVNPTEFIESITDFDKTRVAFEAMPDFSVAGEQEVSIIVADASGNGVREKATLTVYEDYMPPSIEGVQNLNVAIGGTVSYKKGVTVVDDCDPSVKLEIDSSAVDLTKAGEYPVYYSATDAAGNTTTVEAIVKVAAPSLDNVTIDYVNQKADELLARITDASMTPYQKAEKIYWWCHDNIAYVDQTPKVSVEDGAYRGLVQHKGDCYTYAMTAKILLTRAGITNMDIERIPEGDMMHYWNLIDVGEGWKHFDTTRRADKTTFFYWDDASIKAYSDTHKGTHNYDRSKYPVIL